MNTAPGYQAAEAADVFLLVLYSCVSSVCLHMATFSLFLSVKTQRAYLHLKLSPGVSTGKVVMKILILGKLFLLSKFHSPLHL